MVNDVQSDFDAPVSHEQARESAQRLINSLFGRIKPTATASIPARPDDDDLVITRYIEQCATLEAAHCNRLEAALEEARADADRLCAAYQDETDLRFERLETAIAVHEALKAKAS